MGEPLRRKTFPALISCSPRCGCSEYVVTVTIGTILVVCLFKMVLNHVIYCNAVRYCVLNKAAKVKFKKKRVHFEYSYIIFTGFLPGEVRNKDTCFK